MHQELTPEKEIIRLKMKSNAQLERIHTIESENFELVKTLKALQNQVNAESEKRDFSQTDILFIVIRDFVEITKVILKNQQIIPFTYESKNSQDFYKVKKEIFENYTLEISELLPDRFIRYSAKLLLLKSDKGRCVFKSNSEKIFFLNKTVVDAVKQWIDEGAETEKC